MAPRRGGSSFHGSDDTDSTSSNSMGVWGAQTELAGSGFHNAHIIARAIFLILAGLVLVGVGLWSIQVKKQSVATRPLFKFTVWGSAITCSIVYFLYYFSSTVVLDVTPAVYNPFFPIDSILSSFSYPGEIGLLLCIYTLLHMMGQNEGRGRSALHGLHIAICSILTVLFVAILGLKIAYSVFFVESFYRKYTQTINIFDKIDGAYTILYFVCTLEICGLAVLNFISGRAKRASLIFLTVVCPVLFVRLLVDVIVAIRYELMEHLIAKDSVVTARIFFYSFCTAILFPTVLVVSMLIERSGHHVGPISAAPQSSGQGGYGDVPPPQQPYPPMGYSNPQHQSAYQTYPQQHQAPYSPLTGSTPVSHTGSPPPHGVSPELPGQSAYYPPPKDEGVVASSWPVRQELH